jgi:hypothetical protein
MRSLLLLCALASTGCASTVFRLEGEAVTPGGTADTPCEVKEWLVIAPTRAEVAEEKTGKSHPENGLGLYRVGGHDPESIPGLDGLPPSVMVEKKREALAPYETRQYVAGALGSAGAIAIAVGTILFVNAFETKRVQNSDGSFGEESSVNGSTAAAGGIVVGAGFALGITGLVVNPSHAERTQANATRYVFLPPDQPKQVESLVLRHNKAVREQCADQPN